MDRLQQWWNNGLPKPVKFVFLVLLLNALPAISILMTLPGRTEDPFVWTVLPEINVRLLGVGQRGLAAALPVDGAVTASPRYTRLSIEKKLAFTASCFRQVKPTSRHLLTLQY